MQTLTTESLDRDNNNKNILDISNDYLTTHQRTKTREQPTRQRRFSRNDNTKRESDGISAIKGRNSLPSLAVILWPRGCEPNWSTTTDLDAWNKVKSDTTVGSANHLD